MEVSSEDAREGMIAMGMPEWLVDTRFELFEVREAGCTAGVTNTVAQITGREPRSYELSARVYKELFSGSSPGLFPRTPLSTHAGE